MATAGAAATMFLFHYATKDQVRLSGFIQELNPDRPQILLCSALILLGAGQLLAPGLFLLPAKFLMGVICLIITLLLAGASPRAANGRAAVALALALILSNAGTETAAWLEEQSTGTSLPPLISAPAVRLTGLIILLTALTFRALVAQIETGRFSATEAPDRGLGPPELNRLGQSADGHLTVGAGEAIDPGLTSREEEIMGLAAKGCGNRQIADRLNIQEATVRFHLRNIYKKTGLKNRRELPVLASRLERDKNQV
jgi:Response regulator containing a CheY-like receiver domain and an HTH DNA-binding domain